MRPSTIRDVAEKAGVSASTVSRVLNNSKRVSDDTRQRVLEAIRELNYSPNTIARQLSVGKTYTIGVVTPFFTYPSFAERLAGIQEALDESGYTLVLYSVRFEEQIQWQLTELVSQQRVDGLIVLSLPFDVEEINQINPDFPVITVDNDAYQHYPHVIIDDVKGGQLATEYLIRRGHRAIGFIGDQLDKPVSFTSTSRRFEGFQQAMKAHDLTVNEEWCWRGEHSHEAARQSATRILSLPACPTAIFASLDTYAFGVLAAADDLGLRVPDDIAVIGFDDIQMASFLNLTTVKQFLFESGKTSAAYMLDWLYNNAPDRTQWRTEMSLQVIERATV